MTFEILFVLLALLGMVIALVLDKNASGHGALFCRSIVLVCRYPHS